jgi:hypothetical protein
MKHTDYRYRQCPATTDLARNTFIVRSPFDAHFTLDADQRTLEFHAPHVQSLDFFNMRDGQYGTSDAPLLSINFHQVFLTQHKNVELTITAPWFETDAQQFRVVPGRFCISSWWRPIDFALQLPERRSTVRIKKNQALFYVGFSTGNSTDRAELRDLKLTPQLENFMGICTQAKHYQPRCPLRTLYGLFDKYKHKPRLEFTDK